MSDAAPVTMLGTLRKYLARQGWRERDARATPELVAVLEWSTGGEVHAHLLIHTTGAADLVELEHGEPVALTRWEAVTPHNIHRMTRYVEGAQR